MVVPNKLTLLVGEYYPTERTTIDKIDDRSKFVVEDIVQMGKIVYEMQNELCNQSMEMSFRAKE